MEVREIDLPGVGRKFAIVSRDGTRITVIIHNTGPREIYHFRPGEDFPFHAVRLEDDEARKLSAILGGAYFQPDAVASMDLVLAQLSIEWVKVRRDTLLAGATIAKLDVRRETGASILAVLRDGQVIANPEADETLTDGDTIVVAGSREQVERFLAFASGQGR
jgi:TrkA domain protein